MYTKSKILFSFGCLLVSIVNSKALHLGLRIIFHLSLYLYPKVVFRYIGRSIRFLTIADLSVGVTWLPKSMVG